MCQGQDAGDEVDVAGALAMLDRALGVLAAADVASLPAGVQGDVLRALGRAESRQTAARARVLAAFIAQDGYHEDGHGGPRSWLRWQTRITGAAAAGAVGWARRLAAHPVVAGALAAGELSPSWARLVCGWSERLPADRRADADQIMVGAARGGAELADLAGLAEEMFRRCAGPDHDGDDGFAGRYFNLGLTWRGAGRAEGDLAPGCAAALGAVLEALGKKAGPEDVRSAGQRRHDALEEACRRLSAAGMVPGRAGQPTQLQVHMSLAELRGLPGAPEAERAWAAARASQPGWLTGPAAEAAACDATVIPVVTGHPDPAALDDLATAWPAPTSTQAASTNGPGDSGMGGSGRAGGAAGGQALSGAGQRRLRQALLGLAAGALSGPGGLAAHLRTTLAATAAGEAALASSSLPLDMGAASEIIPAHLRRAVTTRHRHCAFPGCDQPASACQIHHITPRAKGGPAALHNLIPLCSFHHLTAIHRWGWTITLNPDATPTATSPDGTRTLRSHGPPAKAA